MKICTKCGLERLESEFYKTKTTKDGLTYNCKECYAKYREQNKAKAVVYMQHRRATDNEVIKHTKRKSWKGLDPRKKMLQQAKNRAYRKGLEFDLELEDIIIPERCPLLGVPFIVGTKNNYELTHSLDRINPELGYIKGNIWVITKKANSMKNSATKVELLYFAEQIQKYFKEDDIVRTNEKSLELQDKELVG